MAIQIIPKAQQATGAFNGGEIVENKPVGFPGDGGVLRPYSNIFYWAYAEAKVDSTIGLHPHQGFEIMSFILKGHIRHYDTKLQEWRPLQAGDVQIIRAGNGISHAEFIGGGGAIFQIWFDPDLSKTLQQPASYDDYADNQLPLEQQPGLSVKTYIGPGSPVTLDTPGLEVRQLDFSQLQRHLLPVKAGKIYSLYVLSGSFAIGGEPASPDDFVLCRDLEGVLQIDCLSAGAIFLIESPAQPGYRTYAQMMRAGVA